MVSKFGFLVQDFYQTQGAQDFETALDSQFSLFTVPQWHLESLPRLSACCRRLPVNQHNFMRDFQAFRHTAIRYWERRRIIYNLVLIPPSLFAYMLTAGFAYVGDPHPTLYGLLLFWFAMYAIGANICYSFAYVLEFLFGSDDPTSRWLRFGRTTSFVIGVLFAMLLALIGGRNIAMMEFYEQAKHVG